MNPIDTTIDTYDRTAKEYANNVKKIYLKNEMNYFMSLLPKNSTILDLGCGSGRDAKIFTDNGYKVIGIDLSEKLLEIAKETAPKAYFHKMDMLDLEFVDNYFRGIWANASLVHIPKKDIFKFLQESYEISNGIMFASFKIGSGETFQEDKRYKGNTKKFYAFYELSELEKLAKQVGFKVLKFDDKTAKVGKEYAISPWDNLFLMK